MLSLSEASSDADSSIRQAGRERSTTISSYLRPGEDAQSPVSLFCLPSPHYTGLQAGLSPTVQGGLSPTILDMMTRNTISPDSAYLEVGLASLPCLGASRLSLSSPPSPPSRASAAAKAAQRSLGTAGLAHKHRTNSEGVVSAQQTPLTAGAARAIPAREPSSKRTGVDIFSP